MESEPEMLREILQLTRENNRMLHAMRRSAFLGGVFKIVLWLVFLLVPIWLYMHYLQPVVASMMDTMTQIQDMKTGGENQFKEFNSALQKLRDQFPSYFSTPK